MEIIGYTHSDGYCLCVDHATELEWSEKQGKYITVEMKDPGNESGHVQPIFDGEETDSDLICDPCFTKAMAEGSDVTEAIILKANIGPEAEEDEDNESEEEESEEVEEGPFVDEDWD